MAVQQAIPSRIARGYRFRRRALYRAIAQQIDNLDISWREAARQAGVYDMTLHRIKDGIGPTLEHYGRICAWLEVDLDEFYS